MIDLTKTSCSLVGLLCLSALAATSTVAARPAPSIVSSVTRHREFVGQCFSTRVAKVEFRLEIAGKPVPGTGSVITLTDGHYTVDYDQLPAVDKSKAGDHIRLCVLQLPTQCPRGDTRGIRYRGRNLRTGLSWVAADAEHMCGGA